MRLPTPQLDFLTERGGKADDEIRAQVLGLLTKLYPRNDVVERRRENRYPFPCFIHLTPVAEDGITPEGETVVVVGKDISEHGLGFYHQAPLPHRRMIASMESSRGRSACISRQPALVPFHQRRLVRDWRPAPPGGPLADGYAIVTRRRGIWRRSLRWPEVARCCFYGASGRCLADQPPHVPACQLGVLFGIVDACGLSVDQGQRMAQFIAHVAAIADFPHRSHKGQIEIVIADCRVDGAMPGRRRPRRGRTRRQSVTAPARVPRRAPLAARLRAADRA